MNKTTNRQPFRFSPDGKSALSSVVALLTTASRVERVIDCLYDGSLKPAFGYTVSVFVEEMGKLFLDYGKRLSPKPIQLNEFDLKPLFEEFFYLFGTWRSVRIGMRVIECYTSRQTLSGCCFMGEINEQFEHEVFKQLIKLENGIEEYIQFLLKEKNV